MKTEKELRLEAADRADMRLTREEAADRVLRGEATIYGVKFKATPEIDGDCTIYQSFLPSAMKTVLMLSVMIALLGCTTSTKTVDLSGLRKFSTGGPILDEPVLNPDGTPKLDAEGKPMTRDLLNPREMSSSGDRSPMTSAGADGSHNFIFFIISQNDGEVSGATTDAAARLALSLQSPSSTPDAGGDNNKTGTGK